MQLLPDYQDFEAKKDLAPVFKGMQLFEEETYPLERAAEVRASAYAVSIKTKFKFRTKTLREKDLISITRIA